MTTVQLLGVLAEDAFWSALAALGFAVLFNVPPRHLPACMGCAALGHALRTLVMQWGGTIEFGTLLASTTVGFVAYGLSRRRHAPSTLFAIPGVIPLIPGAFAYRAMLGLVTMVGIAPEQATDLLAQAGVNLIRTGLMLGAIGVGIAAPAILLQREDPVV
ncbi:MAG: threonine/serine exporter family protein [Armatimonadetes bacterium]|nr:threonine/serine exporter family protein [Anaerolineae bacterium]